MDQESEAPLLRDEAATEDEYHDADRSEGRQHDGDRISLFMWMLSFSAAISGLLFGYDTGVISATLVSLGTSLSDRQLTSADKSIITSCTSLFALVASPLSSVLADAWGRRMVILVADILFIVGALIQAGSHTVLGMVLGRSIVGLAVGAASFVTPLYIAELAPAAFRGRLVTMNVLSITLGQVIAYVIGWILSERGDPTNGWRWLVGFGALPALIQALLVVFMSETPRWLVKAGRSMAARRVIERACSFDRDSPEAERILTDIEAEVREEESGRLGRDSRGKDGSPLLATWRELTMLPKHRRALVIACLLQGLQQLCGFNSLMYFSATIFTLLSFSIPTLTSLSVAATNLCFTVVALLLIDRIGRRRILLYSIPCMAVGLFLSAFGFRFIRLPSMDVALTRATSDSPPSSPPSSFLGQNTAATMVMLSMIIYVASYALGLGNVPWMQSELFPLSVRSLGSGMATATNWMANFVIGLTFLPMMDLLTPTWTFVLYGMVCVSGWVAIFMIYPETSGLSLEEATGLLENGWGVK